jgi:hypothetical protein
MPHSRAIASRVTAAASILCAAVLALTACGSVASAPVAAPRAGSGAVDLAAAGCPATVVIQTDWNPEAEHGAYYSMVGPDPVIDADKKTVSGPLYSQGKPTGVNLEVRAGGPAIGFQGPVTQMYTDPTITLAFSATDGDIQVAAKTPVVAVVAPTEVNPQIVMWDPATYPKVKTIADLGKTRAVVRYFDGAGYMQYLTGSGQLKTGQIDGGYDGTPANFLAAGGKDAQQGFASAEPFIYQHDIKGWMKPVAFQLVADAGWSPYASELAVKKDSLEPLSGCLKKLVPIIQQATVDYFANPEKTNALIVKLVDDYSTGWTYSTAIAKFAVAQQLKLGLVGNGPDGTVGNFDPARVQKLWDVATPVLTDQGTPPVAGAKPTDYYTNEFIDPSIGFK